MDFVIHAHECPESFQNYSLPETFSLGFGKNCLVQLLITYLAVVGLLTGALNVGFCQCLSDLRGARCLLMLTNGHWALAPNSPPQIKSVLETDFVGYC